MLPQNFAPHFPQSLKASPHPARRRTPTLQKVPCAADSVPPCGEPPRVAEPGASLCLPRCRERGCVFPVAFEHSEWCLYHERIRCEPNLFHSFQPTHLIVDQGRYTVPTQEWTELPFVAIPPSLSGAKH